MAENTTNKDRLKEITDSIESGIKDLFQSDRYMQYLRTMSRFNKYSVNNTMLIYLQRPDATLVAGFNKWKDQLSRSVMKGEKGIKIIAPTPFKKKIEEQKLDPDTKMPVLDSDGKVVMEEKTVQIPMYKVVSVFDVAQTDGKPLPTIAADLAGNVQNYEVFMEALRRSAPVPITFEKMTADMDGFFSPDHQRIAIREGMSEVQTVSATVHEIAHSKLHNYQQAQEQAAAGDETAAPVKKKDRNTEEVEAESISFAVCAYYGIATGDNSFGYIATWSENKELPELRASLETINKTASGLITDIDRNYAAICKERGIDQTKEPEKQPGYEEWSEPATAQNAPEVPDTPSDDVSAYLPQEQPLDGERIVDVKIETYDPNAPLPPFPADYQMPDPTVTIADRDAYGYTENDMLPLSHEKAAEFFLKDETIYMLDPGNSAGMAFDMDDIDHHNGLFGIRREDWDNEREYLELAEGHEMTDQEVENSFLHNPADAFAIHDANTDLRKKELFAKVRSGSVRVLIGSTEKMGAGTNVQDRLVALHDLDCPWRPRDLSQRKGRIVRQFNKNEKVYIFRYVTEGTFDAYLWQTVENKQRFISQIMTSKSPVRSCDDVDETALSFAEIKALCAGDPRIKERMDLDVEVTKLKIMKADHQSKQFRMEDSLLKYFPEKIEESKGFIRGLETDRKTLAAHPLPAEGFVGMEIRGDKLTDKENAGAALLDACKEVKSKEPVPVGSYRGLAMSVSFDTFEKEYVLTLKGEMTHRVELGTDARGNLTRIENVLDKVPARLSNVQAQLDNLYQQQAAAKAEVGKPFPQEQELKDKIARLVELDTILNLDDKTQTQPETAIAKSARPSVLDKLKTQPVHNTPDKPHKKALEAR